MLLLFCPKEWLTGDFMKGYYVPAGYMGLTDDGWMLFETEAAYIEYMTKE